MSTRLLCVLLFRMRAWGVEHVPRRGGVVVASNHQSFLDPPLVGVAVARPLHYLARRSLFVPGFGRLLRALNAFPVERGEADLRAIRQAIRLVRDGAALALFPEGTRTADGQVHAFKPGFALVAARGGVPIVPVAVHGAFEAWPRTRLLPVPGRCVSVAYGEPMPPPETHKDACRAAAAAVEQRVAELLEMLRARD